VVAAAAMAVVAADTVAAAEDTVEVKAATEVAVCATLRL